jgi:hypothetical protein
MSQSWGSATISSTALSKVADSVVSSELSDLTTAPGQVLVAGIGEAVLP